MTISCALLRAAALSLCLSAAVTSAHAVKAGCVTARDGRVICPEPDSRCLADRHGEVVCSTPGGGIMLNRHGDAVCGAGYCTTDLRGEIFCSSAARGAVAVDRYGNAACSHACVEASARACVRPASSSK